MQTRRQSAIETTVNYVVGFTLAWLINRYVLSWLGYPIKAGETTSITLLITLVSVFRSYILRRCFNHWHK